MSTADEIREATERLREAAAGASRLLAASAVLDGDIPDGHPHAALIAGMRDFASWLVVHPDFPEIEMSITGHAYEWDADANDYDERGSVDKLIHIAAALGVRTQSHLSGGGQRHWNADCKFGAIAIGFHYITDPSTADYRAPDKQPGGEQS